MPVKIPNTYTTTCPLLMSVLLALGAAAAGAIGAYLRAHQ
jgi:hypothetical protein